MHAQNTAATYGTVARTFHWVTALLILTLIPLGFVAESWPYASPEEVAQKAQLFSLHKTLGVAALFVAVLRVLWALSQTHPAPLHPERRLETFAATLVHWLLYGALIVVPASGWLYHATTEGFAPIWWPFGQDLPMVPKSEALGALFKGVHKLGVILLIASLLAHIAGALKHAIIDRDATLGRMTHGRAALPATTTPALQGLPAAAAVVIWAGVLFTAWTGAQVSNAPAPAESVTATPAAPPATGANVWLIESGRLALTVPQMGSNVGGTFNEWAAQIRFDETPDADGVYGDLDVVINVASVTLGSVSDQAKGPEFFDTANHPTAQFLGQIRKDAEGRYIADGTLTLRGQTAPVSFPFDLTLDGQGAEVRATTTLDRRDFGIGPTYRDEATVGFTTTVEIELTATRSAP